MKKDTKSDLVTGGGQMERERASLKCPLCGWETRSKNVMNVHIKVGHTQDEVNGAVDDGGIIEDPTWFFTPAP